MSLSFRTAFSREESALTPTDVVHSLLLYCSVRRVISLPAANRNSFVPAALLACCLLLPIAGCNRGQTVSGEVAYVSAVQATLRDRVAAVYNKTGAVSNGEKVAVLEHAHNGRCVRVR